MTNNLILLSAGGTGGHVLPAAALADDLRARGFDVALVTDVRGKKYVSSFGTIPVHVIAAGTLGAGIAGKVKGIAGLALGIVQSFPLLLKLKPAAVVGFGGYPSVPAVFAAQLMGIPTVIHEQNAVLGKANALLAKMAKVTALSWGEGPLKRGHVVTGPLVRADIAALNAVSYPALVPGGELRIFVMGGSQGAGVLGKVIPAALAGLSPEQRARLSIVQQCRPDDIETVRQVYAKAGIKARLDTFIADAPAQFAATHLFIGRSGGTIFEATAAGRPGIYIPYPYHADQQQKHNAERVAKAGGGWVMLENAGFTEQALLAKMREFIDDPGVLSRAAQQARSCGKPDAARQLGDVVASVIQKRK